MEHRSYILLTWLSIPIVMSTVQTDWRPIKSRPDFAIGPRISHTASSAIAGHRKPILDSCSLHKAVMDQYTFHQYIQYKHHIPELMEFTLCAWHKFYNHSTDQPIFSYALPHKARAIFSWISNTVKKSYYMLAINGHTIYRLNYPMKLNKWYHMCQSWNGKTGEWQLWINNERISRGYYNLMVGKPIKSGGIAITGQEQTDFGSGFGAKGKGAGFQGEITLLQLYKAALTVGKAYTDHKHHHVHVFTHDGGYEDDDENGVSSDDGDSDSETEGGEEEDGTPPKDVIAHGLATEHDHPHFENGQLKHIVPAHELLAKPPIKPAIYGNPDYHHHNHHHPHHPHHPHHKHYHHSSSPFLGISPSKIPKSAIRGNAYAPHNFKFLKGPPPSSIDFEIVGKRITDIRPKRQLNYTSSFQTEEDWIPIDSTANVDTAIKQNDKVGGKSDKDDDDDDDDKKSQKKRDLVIEEHIISPIEFTAANGISNLYSYSDGHEIPDDDLYKYFAQHNQQQQPPLEGADGNHNYHHNQQNSKPSSTGKKQSEPAEWEVRKLSEICSGCKDDPFRKANVLSWQETPKKLFAGAQYVPAVPKCYVF